MEAPGRRPLESFSHKGPVGLFAIYLLSLLLVLLLFLFVVVIIITGKTSRLPATSATAPAPTLKKHGRRGSL